MPSQSREKQLLKIREERSHTQLFFFFLDGSVIFVFVAPGESRMKEQKRKREKEKETILKTAVIYARYSSDKQTEQSIEGQLRVCKDYAQRNDIVILDTYIDRAMTGKNDHRGSFQRMMKDSHKRQWDYVLVYKLNRFSRNKYETAMHKKTLRDNGIRLLSAMENIPETPEGIILESLLEGMAEYYSAELAQKVKRGRHETRLKGLFPGGVVMYGYRLENRKLVVDENQAEVVRYVFEEYAKGVYVDKIIKALTEKGIYHRGKPFPKNTIYNLLKNEKYTGIYRLNDTVYENVFPRIISDELFDKVRAISEKNHYGKRSITTVYLLRGKMVCGYCGYSIIAETGTARNGALLHYYKCRGRKQKNGCRKEVVPQVLLEQMILNAITDNLQQPDTMEKLIDGIMQVQESRNESDALLKQLYYEKKQVQPTIQNIMAAAEKGVVTATTTSRLLELETTLNELEQKIAVEKCKQPVRLTREQIRTYYGKALKLEPQLLISYLVRRIVLFDDRAEIEYNTPTDTTPGDGRGILLDTIGRDYTAYSVANEGRQATKHMDIDIKI